MLAAEETSGVNVESGSTEQEQADGRWRYNWSRERQVWKSVR